MTINARSKGQRGEREVIALLVPVIQKVYESHGLGLVTPELKRNLMQSMEGGYDIIGLDWLALEVKRVENQASYNREQWWAQARKQTKEGQETVLFYRPNNTSWKIRMFGYLCVGSNGGVRVRTVVDINVASFLAWFEQRLIHELARLRAAGTAAGGAA